MSTTPHNDKCEWCDSFPQYTCHVCNKRVCAEHKKPCQCDINVYNCPDCHVKCVACLVNCCKECFNDHVVNNCTPCKPFMEKILERAKEDAEFRSLKKVRRSFNALAIVILAFLIIDVVSTGFSAYGIEETGNKISFCGAVVVLLANLVVLCASSCTNYI